jgi:hypothetical protein
MMKQLIVGLCLPLSAMAGGWDFYNNPFKMNHKFESRYERMPLSGEFENSRKGWPAHHWPNNVGGIAHRWSSGNPQNFSYNPYSLYELRNLDASSIYELSPAEKIDIYNGNYSYPLTRSILQNLSQDESDWHGICHGVAPASLNHEEPQTVTLTNRDGIQIIFYSSDVAALLSYFYAEVSNSHTVLIGSRCNLDDISGSSGPVACEDINAGAFHIILTNRLGREGESFIADIDRRSEVWNHVAINYSSSERSEEFVVHSSAPGTVRRIRLETIVTYAAAIAPKFQAVIGTSDAEYAQNTYEYILDLDRDGKVIGGEWVSDVRPDFVWTQGKSSFLKDWYVLNEIYRPIP